MPREITDAKIQMTLHSKHDCSWIPCQRILWLSEVTRIILQLLGLERWTLSEIKHATWQETNCAKAVNYKNYLQCYTSNMTDKYCLLEAMLFSMHINSYIMFIEEHLLKNNYIHRKLSSYIPNSFQSIRSWV